MVRAAVSAKIDGGKFARDLRKESIIQVATRMPGLLSRIRPQVETLVGDAIVSSPEYQSLRTGVLREHFGLGDQVNVDFIVDTIVEDIQANIILEYFPSANDFGFVRVEILKRDLSDLFLIPGTSYTSPPSGETIPWLHWLLFEGDSIILPDYRIRFGSRKHARSRTGRAVMVANSIEGWGVPHVFAGVATDNWLTRAVGAVSPRIFNLITNAIAKL